MSFTPWNRGPAPSDSDGLEPLGWATLSARLSATHRLRRELLAGASPHPRCGTASFAPEALGPRPARELPGSAQLVDGVNLEPLGDGKAGDGMDCGTDGEHPDRDCRTRGLQ